MALPMQASLLSMLFFIAGLMAFPVRVSAQAVSGDLVGVVTDPTGAVVPKVTVTAQNETTSVKATATTDAGGTYRLSNLPAGDYTVSAASSGFSTATVKGVTVRLNIVVTQNFQLSVGQTSTTVEVTEAATAIDTTTAQLQATYGTQQLEELPSAAFSRTAGIQANVQSAAIWNVSLFSAGVASNGGVGQGTGPTVSGQRPENNSFYVDGVANINHYSTGPLAVVSTDAVAEVSVLQNQFSPEFGGASGGVFNALVKSGGNQIHGSFYEYLQNRDLNADDAIFWVQGIKSYPRYDSNRLGATIGGPLIKNKFFYFGNIEYNPIGQASTPNAPVLAPTAAGYATLAKLPQVSQTNLGVLQKYLGTAAVGDQGTSTVGTATIPLGNVSFVGPNWDNNYNAVVSLDYNVSEKDSLRGRWIYNRITGIDNQPTLPSFYVLAPNNTYFYSLSEFHIFSPTLQNEFRSSFSRNNQKTPLAPQTFPGMNIFPDIDVDELNLQGIGGGSTEPSGSIQNLLQLQDNITKVAGKHNIKAGYSFTDVILTNYFIQRVRGEYEYSSLQQYLYDLTPDVLGERSAGPSAYPTGFLQNAAYVNDDFRVRTNLTLNLGVRYEYLTMPIASRAQIFSAPANVPGGLTFGKPKYSPNDWSPRVGFAYSLGKSNDWVIRGGFSRSFDVSYANLTSNAAPPYYQTTQDVDLNSNAPNFLKNGALAGIAPGLPTNPVAARGIIGSYTFSNNRPYGLTWTLGVQRRLGNDYTLEVRYVGTKGVHLWNQSRLNIESRVNPSNYIPTFLSMPSPATFASLPKTLAQVRSYIVPGGTAKRPFDMLAQYGFENNIVGYAPQAYSFYNGLAVQLTKRFSKGFSYVAAYTWSHNLDDATATNFSTYLTPRRAQDFQNLRAEWASSALDRRQRFTFTPIYDWRPFRDKSWVMKNVVGNWTVSGSYTYQTPEFATVQSGTDSNLNNDSAGDRTIINPAGQSNIGTGVTGYNAQGQPVVGPNAPTGTIVAYVANNSNARYVVAAAGALANGGRNTFPLKPTNNIDLGLAKRFNVTERVRFELIGQFFNVLNHAQYTGGYATDAAGSQQINSRNDLIPSNPLFGRFDQFYSSNSRVGQVAARVMF
jgi:Carboxypeptidase regulatory-like domain